MFNSPAAGKLGDRRCRFSSQCIAGRGRELARGMIDAVSSLRLLRVIARLKWVLTLRHYRLRWGTALASGCGLLALLCVVIGGMLYLLAVCRMEGPEFRDVALLWSTWILSVSWVAAPLLQLDTQRNLDLNGLRLLPLSRTTFTLAVLLDAALSPLGLFFLPLVLLAVAAYSLSWAEVPLMLLSWLLLAVCWLGLGQALYLWANRLLMSRRFADISIGITVLVFVAIQAVNLTVQSADQLSIPPWLSALGAVMRGVFTPLIAWLFPGLAARAVAAGAGGQWLVASGLYLALAAQAALCGLLAGTAARQFYDGELESGGQAPRQLRPRRARSAAGRALLSGARGALFHRERLYLARDPLLKMLLVQSLVGALYFVAVAVMISFRGSDGPGAVAGAFRSYMVLGLAMALSFVESAVLLNKFGYEGTLATHVLLSPVDRGRLLAAKSVFFMSHFATINVILVGGLAAILRAPLSFAAAGMLMVAVNTAIVDLAGHFVSIYFPFTYRRKGRRMRAVMPQPGCGYALLYMLVFNLCNVAVLPSSAAIGLGVVFFGWPGLALGAVAAGLIVYLAYTFGLPAAARALLSREPELVAALSKSVE